MSEPTPPDRPRLHVVIVNFRVGPLAVDALASLAPQVAARPGTRVTVVDNASGDGSVDTIGAAIRDHGWGDWCELVAHPVNGGFAAGNNVAFRRALAAPDPPDAFLLLNPDARAEPGCLEALGDTLARRPDVSCGGVQVLDEDGAVRRSAFRFPTPLGELDGNARVGLVSRFLGRWAVAPEPPTELAPIDWVSGAGFFVRRRVLEEVGLMDEGFFLYFEETDFCARAAEAGHPCWYLPDARIVHVGGQSTGVTGKARADRKRRPPYWFESRRRYYLKHGGAAAALLADAAMLSGLGLARVKRALTGRASTDPPALARDLLRHAVTGPLTVAPSPPDEPAPR